MSKCVTEKKVYIPMWLLTMTIVVLLIQPIFVLGLFSSDFNSYKHLVKTTYIVNKFSRLNDAKFSVDAGFPEVVKHLGFNSVPEFERELKSAKNDADEFIKIGDFERARINEWQRTFLFSCMFAQILVMPFLLVLFSKGIAAREADVKDEH